MKLDSVNQTTEFRFVNFGCIGRFSEIIVIKDVHIYWLSRPRLTAGMLFCWQTVWVFHKDGFEGKLCMRTMLPDSWWHMYIGALIPVAAAMMLNIVSTAFV